MEKEKILFIINPISGAKSKKLLPDLIRQIIDSSKYQISIVETQSPGHAEVLTREGMKSGYVKFVAVGGDGTVNEVARTILNSQYQLGILPSGSGNGLARHLKIPLKPSEALATINEGKVIKIDSGLVNGKPFFCTSGVGFDAYIGKLFAESATRGFNTYVKTALTEFFNYNPSNYIITVNNKSFSRKAFLISFANSSQYGNNAHISPHANIQDGLLDLCLLSPFPKHQIIPFGISLFNKTAHKSKYLEIIQTKEITIERACEGAIHLDGEPYEMGKLLNIKIQPASLNVIVLQG